MEQLSPCTTISEPALQSYRSATREATMVRSLCATVKSSPGSPQLEKAREQLQRPSAVKNILNQILKNKWIFDTTNRDDSQKHTEWYIRFTENNLCHDIPLTGHSRRHKNECRMVKNQNSESGEWICGWNGWRLWRGMRGLSGMMLMFLSC